MPCLHSALCSSNILFPSHPHLWPCSVPDSSWMEVRSDRFGWGRGGSARCWASGVWPEITWWHGLQGAGFPQQQVPEGVPPGLALAVEVRWWKLQCSTLGPGGWVVLVWFGVVLLGGKDSSTCLLFPVADGRLRGLAPGGSGETHLGSPMAFGWYRALCFACTKAALSVSTAWQAD